MYVDNRDDDVVVVNYHIVFENKFVVGLREKFDIVYEFFSRHIIVVISFLFDLYIRII